VTGEPGGNDPQEPSRMEERRAVALREEMGGI